MIFIVSSLNLRTQLQYWRVTVIRETFKEFVKGLTPFDILNKTQVNRIIAHIAYAIKAINKTTTDYFNAPSASDIIEVNSRTEL